MWEVVVLVAVVGVGILVYNSLVSLRERAEGAWADIDVQLRRRHDLVPNLVETVRGYARHEEKTLDEVIQARSRAIEASGPGERGRAEGTLTNALHSLFALAEGYPELRAAEGFRELHSTLVELEDHIQNARRYYNAVVRDYNTRIGQVPSNLIARAFAFEEREFFEASPRERVAPQVRSDADSDG